MTYCAFNECPEHLGGAEVGDFGPRNHFFHLVKNEEIFFAQSVFVHDHSFERIENTGVGNSDMSMESYTASVPHPNDVLLVLRPVLEFYLRQSFWWLDPKPRHQEIEQRFHIRKRLVSQQERFVKCRV